MIEAVVQTGKFETPYRRQGSGSAVLLLTAGLAAETGDWLFQALSLSFRTIAPTVPEAVADGGGGPDRFVSWLRGVIDGLGLESPAVVGPATTAGSLLAFAALDPHRLHRLVLVHGAAESPAAPSTGGTSGAEHPLLRLALPVPADDEARNAALRDLRAFLGAPPPAAQAVSASRSLS